MGALGTAAGEGGCGVCVHACLRASLNVAATGSSGYFRALAASWPSHAIMAVAKKVAELRRLGDPLGACLLDIPLLSTFLIQQCIVDLGGTGDSGPRGDGMSNVLIQGGGVNEQCVHGRGWGST
jgi:hypothetical protein